MGITVSSKSFSVFGDKAAVVADLAFSGNYSFGGLSLDHDQQFGLHDIEMCLIESQSGYSFRHDAANKKIKVFGPAPIRCIDEHHVLDSSYQFQTKYPAAFFMNMTARGANIAFRSTGIAVASLGSNQCCLAAVMADGVRTTVTVQPANCTAVGAIGDGTGWTPGANWSFAGNAAVKASSAATEALTLDTTTFAIGRTYRVIYTVSDWVSGGVKVTIGGCTGVIRTANGTYTEDFLATATTGLTFVPSGTSSVTVDTVYIYDLDVYATYITQAWRDVWANLVQDESVTLSNSGTSVTANQVMALMYIDQITATAGAMVFGDEDETTADSGKVSVALNQTLANIIQTHADQNAKVVKITYIKNPGSGFLFDRAFDNETSTASGSYINTFDYPLLLWGYCGQMPVVNGTTQVLIDYNSATGAGEMVLDWFTIGARTVGTSAPTTGFTISGTSNVTGTGAGVWGSPSEVAAVPLELPEINLAGLTSVKALFIGA
jgi:hypothetical protein